jgi:hypothetical protein
VHPDYRYVIEPPAEGSWTLKVEATFESAPGDRLVLPGVDGAVGDVLVVEGGGVSPLSRARGAGDEGDGYVVPACRARCVVRYTLDLDALASRCHRMDCERRIGDAVLGRASMFMLLPEPMGDAAIHVSVAGASSGRFVTGLRRDRAGGYAFRASELGEASFTAFGAVRERPVELPGARLDVALLGPPLAMGDAAAVGFVQKSAACVASLYGRFPVDATLFVVPVPGASDVVFGRVMSLAGASVALLFGDATPASSVGDNWVVVHELFHLSTPSFVGEGHWLEEGLATYYEPLLRARAGWMSEADLWAHFAREMPRGLRPDGEPPSLEDRDDIDSTYWGGALFALVADVGIRAATHDAHSLDDAVRAVLAREGDATHAAHVADFLRVGDAATDTGELARAYRSWVLGGANPDLAVLWRDLGVVTGGAGGQVTLRDDAPLAAVRRAMTASAPH